MCTPYYLALEGGGDFSGRKEIVLANLVHTHPIKYDNVLTVNWVRRLLASSTPCLSFIECLCNYFLL